MKTDFVQHSSVVERPDVRIENDAVCLCVSCSLKFSIPSKDGALEFDITCPRCGEEKGAVLSYTPRIAAVNHRFGQGEIPKEVNAAELDRHIKMIDPKASVSVERSDTGAALVVVVRAPDGTVWEQFANVVKHHVAIEPEKRSK